jgi:hypothetical protein
MRVRRAWLQCDLPQIAAENRGQPKQRSRRPVRAAAADGCCNRVPTASDCWFPSVRSSKDSGIAGWSGTGARFAAATMGSLRVARSIVELDPRQATIAYDGARMLHESPKRPTSGVNGGGAERSRPGFQSVARRNSDDRAVDLPSRRRNRCGACCDRIFRQSRFREAGRCLRKPETCFCATVVRPHQFA